VGRDVSGGTGGFCTTPQLPITMAALDYSPPSGFSALLCLFSSAQQLFSSNPIVMSVMSVMSLSGSCYC
jgi:hypothetical protein